MANDMTQQPDDSDNLFKVWKASPNPRTLSPLLTKLNPVIDRATRAYGYGGDPNIKTTAQLHVADALHRYDPKKGTKLDTFMFNELKRLRRLGPQQQYAIPMPEQASYDLRSIQRVESDLASDLGRDPLPEELADATGLSNRRITSIKKQYALPTVTEQSFDPMQGMPGQEQEPGEAEHLWNEAVYGEVDDTDKQIMNWSLGLHGMPKMSKTDMAAKLKISIPAITQRARKIAAKLGEGTTYKVY